MSLPTRAIDVFPAIIAQICQEPEEAYWFVWDRGADVPWRSSNHGAVYAFAFESDAQWVAEKNNGHRPANCRVLDGYPRQATLKEAKSARPENDLPIALFDRDLNFIRRLA